MSRSQLVLDLSAHTAWWNDASFFPAPGSVWTPLGAGENGAREPDLEAQALCVTVGIPHSVSLLLSHCTPLNWSWNDNILSCPVFNKHFMLWACVLLLKYWLFFGSMCRILVPGTAVYVCGLISICEHTRTIKFHSWMGIWVWQYLGSEGLDHRLCRLQVFQVV